MTGFIYPTASTTTVFINGYHVDQAYRVDYKESAPKIPIYGYNDAHFSTIANGRVIINGLLIINFVFPGYLTPVLNKGNKGDFVPRLYNYDTSSSTTSSDSQYKKALYEDFTTELPANNSEAEKLARAEYLSSLIVGKNKEEVQNVKDALANFFTSEINPTDQEDLSRGNVRSSVYSSPIDQSSQKNSVNSSLDIYYYTPEKSLFFVRLSDVHFYETAQQISMAGAEGSAEPLFEVYSFIASKKEIHTIGRA